jgi:uncharacterized protein (DUF924 family)
VKRARTTELDSWTEDPKPALALLILLDQFPRNVFRNSADSFASDAKALDIASRSIVKGFDRQLPPFQAFFFYLPFMHSESMVGQVAGMSLLEGALERMDNPESEEGKFFTSSLAFAKRHSVPICQFGRFPSRNEALGRETTKEEEEYLRDHPNGF